MVYGGISGEVLAAVYEKNLEMIGQLFFHNAVFFP